MRCTCSVTWEGAGHRDLDLLEPHLGGKLLVPNVVSRRDPDGRVPKKVTEAGVTAHTAPVHSQSGLLLGNHPANTPRSAVLWVPRVS